MYQDNRLLIIYVEENLHAGTGRGLGAVDLPIQRERTTDYPMVQSSSIKGKLRAECDPSNTPPPPNPIQKDVFEAIFGHEGHDFAGALSFSDAAILLFPVRSLSGVFAWITCPEVMARFRRTLTRLGWNPSAITTVEQLIGTIGTNEAIINNRSSLKIHSNAQPAIDYVVLEDNSFTTRPLTELEDFSDWLKLFMPDGDEYDYFKRNLSKRLCILPDDAFHDFVTNATEIQTHNRLDRDTKTVVNKMLWTSESLPPDSILYSPVLAAPPRTTVNSLPPANRTASGLLQLISDYIKQNLARLQLGGDETTGQGFVKIKVLTKEESDGNAN